MAEEIVNRVAKSKLKVIDLEDFYPKGERKIIDVSEWLYEGLVLREKEFRAHISSHNWEQYRNCFVAMTCSTDAIIPEWAFMLVTTKLRNIAQLAVVGSLEVLETVIYTKIISNLDPTPYENLPVIIKGCSKKPVPVNALILLTQKLQPVAKSIMFGEACSAVPLYKRK